MCIAEHATTCVMDGTKKKTWCSNVGITGYTLTSLLRPSAKLSQATSFPYQAQPQLARLKRQLALVALVAKLPAGNCPFFSLSSLSFFSHD